MASADDRPRAQIYHGDCLDILPTLPSNSVHGIICDPPFGPHEFTDSDILKMSAASGGSWRCARKGRSAVPRFTEYRAADIKRMVLFFRMLAAEYLRVAVPGAHAFIAANSALQHHVTSAFESEGWEVRGVVVRLVQTLRGGDRPKNAHLEFPNATVLPRSKYEPWILFRKRLAGTVAENLRMHGTGALRRLSPCKPFSDIIASGTATVDERRRFAHPTVKPIAFIQHLAEHIMPGLGGTILDGCAGSGTTAVAAISAGRQAVCIEKNKEFFEIMRKRVEKALALISEY